MRDKKLLQEALEKRINGKGGDEIYRYVKRKRVFNFKTGLDNLIFVNGKKIEIGKRHGTKKPIFEKSINDFADENSYKLERTNADVFGYRYLDIESDEMPYLITMNKKVEADDVIELLKKMANYWERPWEALPITSVDRVVSIEPVFRPPEEKTVLSSYRSAEAALVSKMMRALPKEKVRSILGKCKGRTIDEIKEGERSVEIKYVNMGRTYRQRVDIERNRVGTEFAVNTADENVARESLVALSEILLNEINNKSNSKKKEVLAAVR